MKVVIAGASGNLGLHLSRYLADLKYELVLLTHNRPIPADVTSRANVRLLKVDLGNRATLQGCCDSADAVISMSGLLFRGGAEKFLPVTNVAFVSNLLQEAIAGRAKKFILLSFPHVEGETFPGVRAKGIIPDQNPAPLHARTRLQAERLVITQTVGTTTRALILRAGVIYGAGVKLIDRAQWLMRRRFLVVWKQPTWVHLLALPDLLEIFRIAIEDESLHGILNIADDQPMLLQEFLDVLAKHWKMKPPIKLPLSFFSTAAYTLDMISRCFQCSVPLTPEILQMALTSSVADTTRLKTEVGYQLKYPTLTDGLSLC